MIKKCGAFFDGNFNPKLINMKFRGLAHRAQLICEYGGVKFINSSIDTSAERTIKTLESLFGHTVVVISGKNKGLPLERLAEELSRLTVGAVLMGDIGRELAPLLCNGYRYVFADDFNCAVYSACALLDGEGNVILSPAGTSFDKFKNYEKRGDAFCRAVKEYIKTVKDI